MATFVGVLQTLGYLVLAVLLLMLMITIHEFGHYITGKMLRFKIYEFSIGMGKPLYQKTKKNGEVFSIRMIPVGGYCAFGEDDTNIPDTDPDSFNNKAPWKRLIVLFSGAFFNFLSAIIFAVIFLVIMGYGRVLPAATVFNNKFYDPDDPTSTEPETITLCEILNNADNMGGFEFAEEMLIKSINGNEINVLPTTGPASILQNAKEGDTVKLVVILQNGTTAEVTISGITERQWNALCNTPVYLSPDDHVYNNFGGALLKAVPFSFEIAGLVFKILWQLVSGQLGMNSIGGTVATVSVMSDVLGQALSFDFLTAVANIAYLIVLISINLAVFNWLPIPSLDGARMVFVIIEWIRKKPINRDLEAKIHMVGIICLLGFVIFADIFWVFNSLGMHMLL